ncbi:MAG: hypothetical protein NVSMB62_20830 [Acidobacteriaceae bacterium]
MRDPAPNSIACGHLVDADTCKLLWEGDLPFSGIATPSTCRANGKQYVGDRDE